LKRSTARAVEWADTGKPRTKTPRPDAPERLGGTVQRICGGEQNRRERGPYKVERPAQGRSKSTKNGRESEI